MNYFYNRIAYLPLNRHTSALNSARIIGKIFMGRRITRLGAWLARRSRRSLWVALALSLAVNGSFLVLAAYRLPIVPFQPVCWDGGNAFSFGGRGKLYGRMKPEFKDAVENILKGSSVRHDKIFGNVIVVTFVDWWEDLYLPKISTRAVRDIVHRRTGMPLDEAPQWLFAAKFSEHSWYSERYCATMRLIAMVPEGMEPFRPEDDPFWKERLTRKPPEGYEDWEKYRDSRSSGTVQ